MKMLQTMSLSGSMVLLFYILIKMFGRKFFPSSFYKKFLLLSMFFFLFPFPYFIQIYADCLQIIFPMEQWNLTQYLPGLEWGSKIENYVEYTKNGQIRASNWGWHLVSAIGVCAMLFVIGRQALENKRRRKELGKEMQKVRKEELPKIYAEIEKDISIRHKVKIKISQSISSPVTLGVIDPVIFFPKEISKPKDIKLMLAHELIHIKEWDIFWALVSYAILILNFYNPFAYYLCYEWRKTMELACDEKVLQHYAGKRMRTRYGELIIYVAEQDLFDQPIYSAGFGRKDLTKERIKNIMKVRKMGRLKKAAAVGIMAGVTFISSLTVFAYEPDVVWETEEIDSLETEITFWPEELAAKQQCTVTINGEEVAYESKGYDKELIYVDENGKVVVEEFKENGAEARVLCIHNYVNAVATEHKKYDDGSCKTTYYNVVACTKCSKISSKTAYNVQTNKVCSHK